MYTLVFRAGTIFITFFRWISTYPVLTLIRYRPVVIIGSTSQDYFHYIVQLLDPKTRKLISLTGQFYNLHPYTMLRITTTWAHFFPSKLQTGFGVKIRKMSSQSYYCQLHSELCKSPPQIPPPPKRILLHFTTREGSYCIVRVHLDRL
jgi:hypothetical protein